MTRTAAASLYVSNIIPSITNIRMNSMRTIFFLIMHMGTDYALPKSVSFDVGANTTHKYNSDALPAENGHVQRERQHYPYCNRGSAPNEFLGGMKVALVSLLPRDDYLSVSLLPRRLLSVSLLPRRRLYFVSLLPRDCD
jgi:hypothetical protein